MATYFRYDWLNDPEFNFWLEEVKNDKRSAECKLCNVTFCLSNMGKAAIKSHAKGTKHVDRIKAMNNSIPLEQFLPIQQQKETIPIEPDSVLVSAGTSNSIGNAKNEKKVHASQSILNPFLIKEDVSSAEIMWCVQTIMTHKSMRSAGSDVRLFKMMFQDSQVAAKMKLQRSKIAYSVLYGIAPYFKKELVHSLSPCDHFVIGFDESLNKVSQEIQMDLNIRFWSNERSEVCTRYLTSAFLRRTRAFDLLNSFKDSLSPLIDLKKVLQISMDGPNVNHKFFRDLRTDMKNTGEPNDPIILDMGSCGLHIMHGAFKSGIEATDWQIIQFLRAIYYFFKNVPTRRAQLTQYSGSNIYPRKFCAIRWLENENVATRAIEILPHLKKMVEGLKGDKIEPRTASYKIISEAILDPLLSAKLEFFLSLIGESQLFLREYQTDSPMAPFLHSSVVSIIHNLMKRFIKADVIESSSSISRIDLSNKSNFLSPAEVDLGYGTIKAIKKAKKERNITDLQIIQFRKNALNALKVFTEKLLDRSPLKYKLTEAVSCFDPSLVCIPEIRDKQLKSLLTILTEKNYISDNIADEMERDFKNLSCQSSARQEFENYSRADTRLDHFWRDLLMKHGNSKSLFQLVKMVMILSHGNANIERGFSVNSELLVENLKNETLVAQRMIYDSVMHQTNGDVTLLKVPKSLIHSYRNARSRLLEETERKKNETQNTLVEESRRKRIAEAKEILATKKAKLLAEIQAIDEQTKHLQ